MLDDGRCIFNQYFTPLAPPKNLVTGMLTALQGFVREVTGAYPTALSAGGFVFYFEKRGPITVVLITSEQEKTLEEISQISLRFLQKFGDKIDDWRGKTNVFDGFGDDLSELLGETRTVQRIDPTDPLNAFILLELEEEIQNLAKEMIHRKEASSEEMTKITGENEFLTRLKLEKLVKAGHLGRYQADDKYFYFTS